MRIAITHPTTFERVRRGTERFVKELSAWLSGRGHEVRVISCKPGPREVIREDDYVRDTHRRWWHPGLERAGILEAHAFLATSFRELLHRRYDVVQCCSFTDAYAARLARVFTGTPYVFFVNAIPPHTPYFRSVTLRGAVFRRAVRDADELITISDYVGDYCDRRFGRRGVTLPVPVDTKLFSLSESRDHTRPIILCTAALGDRRKGGRTLMHAFNLVKAHRPEARLQICSVVPEETREELLSLVDANWRDDVEFMGAGRPEDLPSVYGRAAVSVLPSVWEAFGLVVIESMATGTPVVGTHDGALVETISSPEVGRTFTPLPGNGIESGNPEGLAQALLETLDLSAQDGTALRCRQHALQYDWEEVGPKYEAIYRRLHAARSTGVA
jgi:glycosyltransferase involved in cell wall biosynthesis